MNRFIYAIVLSGIFAFSAQADDAAGAKLKSLLSGINQFKAQYAQVITDSGNNIVHETKGEVVLARPDKLRWETYAPDDNVLIADGETVWNIDPFAMQVTVMDRKGQLKDNPFMLLTSDDDSVWSKFVIRAADDNASEYIVTPKNGEGQIRELTLLFDGNSLTGLSTLDAQEQTSTILFSQSSTRFPMAADTFQADISGQFMVDDQR